jgi:hypothetical protein
LEKLYKRLNVLLRVRDLQNKQHLVLSLVNLGEMSLIYSQLICFRVSS